jgi:DNA-directed RNA polymerase specialized sigma24 family protein
MTHEQAIAYLEANLPRLRKKFCIASYDEDALQVAAIQFIKSAHKLYEGTSPDGYIYGIFTRKRHRHQQHYNKAIMYCDEISENKQVDHPGTYPWTQQAHHTTMDITERAKEYLDELANPRHKYICGLYFIHGYTQEEIFYEQV